MSQVAHGIGSKICPECGHAGRPLDALFFLESAAMLIPMTLFPLRKLLSPLTLSSLSSTTTIVRQSL